MDQQRHGEDGGEIPAPPRCSDAERERRRVLRFIGSLRRDGRWRLPAISTYVLAVGSVSLDLREAEFGVPDPIIEVHRLVGNVHVIVPPDVEVEVSGAGVIGSMSETGPPTDRSGERLRLRLRGRALVGNVHVERRT